MHHFVQVRDSVISRGKSKRVALSSVARTEIHCEHLEKQKHNRRKRRAAGKTCPIVVFDSRYIYSSILDSDQCTSYLQEPYKDPFVSQRVYICTLNVAAIG